MKAKRNLVDLEPAAYRPVYFWAGPGTIRMNLLKYDVGIDREVHLNAYREEGVRRLKEMGFSTAYVTFDWGFSPRLSEKDRDAFGRVAELCHKQRIAVFAYIQPSNLVRDDWRKECPESEGWLSRTWVAD